MSNPPPYTRAYSFSNWQSSNPTQPLPGQKVDIELDSVAASTGALATALADVRRSDGHLVNDSVHLETLDPFLRQALANETDLEGAIERAETAADEADASEAAATTAAVNAGIARAAAEAAEAGAEASELAALAYKNAIFALPLGTVIRETKALLDLKLDVDENTGGVVTNDPNNDYNWPRLWRKNAASGLGGWTASVDLLLNIDLRLDDLENASSSIDFTDTNTYAIINTPVASPGTKYSTAVLDANRLQYTQNYAGSPPGYFLVGVLTGQHTLKNRSFSVKYKIDQLNELLPGVVAGGVGICINPSSATAMDASGHVTFLWRFGSGNVQAVGADSITPNTAFGPLGVVANAVNSNCRPLAGEDVELVAVLSVDGTSMQLTTYRGGGVAHSATIDGLPAGWLGVCARNSVTSGSPVGTFGPLAVAKIEAAVKRGYVSQASGPSGIGTEENPFTNTDDAILSANESNRRLDLVLKEGLLTRPITIDGSRYDSISIRSDQNRRSIIRTGTVLTSGWTLVDNALYPGVYYRQHVYSGVIGSTTAEGNFVDLTPANSDGWWGFNVYKRQSPLDTLPVDTTIAQKLTTLAAAPIDQGQFLTSYQTGNAYIRCVGAQNPNGLTIFRNEWPTAINITPPAASRVAGYDVFLGGLEAAFYFGYGIRFGRARAEVEDCAVYGGLGAGFASDMASGSISSCKAYRLYADGINNTIGTDWRVPNPPPPRTSSMRLIGNQSTDMLGAADGASNHWGQDWIVIGGDYSRNRSGLAANSTYSEAIGVTMHDNREWGAFLSSELGQHNRFDVKGCDVKGNKVGYTCWAQPGVTGDVTGTSRINITGGIATDNLTLFQCRNELGLGEADFANPAVINVRDLGRVGNLAYFDNSLSWSGFGGFLWDPTSIPRTGGTM